MVLNKTNQTKIRSTRVQTTLSSTPYGSLRTTKVPYVMPQQLKHTVTKSRIYIPHHGHEPIAYNYILENISSRMKLDDRFSVRLISYTFINSFGTNLEISVNSHPLIKLHLPMQQSELVTSQDIEIQTTAPYMLLVKFEYYILEQDLSLPDFVLDDSVLRNKALKVIPITLYPIYEAPKTMNKHNVTKRKRRKRNANKNTPAKSEVNSRTRDKGTVKTSGKAKSNTPVNINVQIRNKAKQAKSLQKASTSKVVAIAPSVSPTDEELEPHLLSFANWGSPGKRIRNALGNHKFRDLYLKATPKRQNEILSMLIARDIPYDVAALTQN